MQLPESAEAGSKVMVPAAQLAQLDWPVLAWYWPAAQLEQLEAPASAKLPATQVVQPEAPLAYLPGPHALQLDWPVTVASVPAVQAVQKLAPVAAVYQPPAQLVQLDSPGEA